MEQFNTAFHKSHLSIVHDFLSLLSHRIIVGYAHIPIAPGRLISHDVVTNFSRSNTIKYGNIHEKKEQKVHSCFKNNKDSHFA